MASRSRYIIGVGLQYVSDRVDAPNSTGKPPACHTPCLTCSARSLRCMWHGFSSDQVLMIAMTGLPACPAASTPSCRIRDLWLNERRLFEPNHPALRSVAGFFAPLAGGRPWGASLASGGWSSAPGHRNDAWGALCGVRPGACGVIAGLPGLVR